MQVQVFAVLNGPLDNLTLLEVQRLCDRGRNGDIPLFAGGPLDELHLRCITHGNLHN